MRKILHQSPLFPLLLLLLLSVCGCAPAQPEQTTTTDPEIFPKGVQAPAEFFTGTAWVYGLVDADTTYTTATGNVLFEPAARSNWHLHPSGQLLIVTSGVGYHQLKDGPREVIKKGDVVRCPPNVLHWHGASENSSMSHIYIVPNTEKGIVEWKEAVTDEEYARQ
ncbi:MAG: cupin domain-containing protein [Phaeodactylibacter sp.]|nr:cupin domain-containing protein [Phaeodactylibacter sp.]